ncbi:MAG: glycosyltransferase family 9 protein [Ignavibacteria bacterium]|nr:glycosyltransferase family 9 protein [Ignavibacteria bacterium]
MKINRDEIRKILVIKFGGMGDVLLSTPVLPNLRAYFPEAEIDYLTLIKNRDILMDNHYINRVLTYDSRIDRSYDLLRHMRKKGYNLVIDLYGNPRTAFLTWMTGAKYRVGFIFRGRSYAYNIKGPGRGGEVHNTDFNLDALTLAGIPIVSKKLNLSVNIVHDEFADKFINGNNLQNEFLIGIALTGGWESKKYKLNDYVEFIMRLNERYKVKYVLIWGNKSELKDAEHIKKLFPHVSFVIPESSIRYLAAIIKKCDVIAGNDSGPLHIAGAMGKPVLGIYGPTNPKLQGPYGEQNVIAENTKLECLHCNLLECPIGNICMTELSKEYLVEKFVELINKNHLTIPFHI